MAKQVEALPASSNENSLNVTQKNAYSPKLVDIINDHTPLTLSQLEKSVKVRGKKKPQVSISMCGGHCHVRCVGKHVQGIEMMSATASICTVLQSKVKPRAFGFTMHNPGNSNAYTSFVLIYPDKNIIVEKICHILQSRANGMQKMCAISKLQADNSQLAITLSPSSRNGSQETTLQQPQPSSDNPGIQLPSNTYMFEFINDLTLTGVSKAKTKPTCKPRPQPNRNRTTSVHAKDDDNTKPITLLVTPPVPPISITNDPQLSEVPSYNQDSKLLPPSLGYAINSSGGDGATSPCLSDSQPAAIQLPSDPYMLEFVSDLNLTSHSSVYPLFSHASPSLQGFNEDGTSLSFLSLEPNDIRTLPEDTDAQCLPSYNHPQFTNEASVSVSLLSLHASDISSLHSTTQSLLSRDDSQPSVTKLLCNIYMLEFINDLHTGAPPPLTSCHAQRPAVTPPVHNSSGCHEDVPQPLPHVSSPNPNPPPSCVAFSSDGSHEDIPTPSPSCEDAHPIPPCSCRHVSNPGHKVISTPQPSCDFSNPMPPPSCHVSSLCHKVVLTPQPSCDFSNPIPPPSCSHKVFPMPQPSCDVFSSDGSRSHDDISTPQPNCDVSDYDNSHEVFPKPPPKCVVSSSNSSHKEVPQSLPSCDVSSPCRRDFPKPLPSCEDSPTLLHSCGVSSPPDSLPSCDASSPPDSPPSCNASSPPDYPPSCDVFSPSDSPTPLPSCDSPAPLPSCDSPAPLPSCESPTPLPSCDSPTPLPSCESPVPLPSCDSPTPLPSCDSPPSCDSHDHKDSPIPLPNCDVSSPQFPNCDISSPHQKPLPGCDISSPHPKDSLSCDVSSPCCKDSPTPLFSCDISSPCRKDSSAPLPSCDVSNPHRKDSPSCDISSPRRKVSRSCDTHPKDSLSCDISSPCRKDFSAPLPSCDVSRPCYKDSPTPLPSCDVSSPCRKDSSAPLPSCDASMTCFKDSPTPVPSCDVSSPHYKDSPSCDNSSPRRKVSPSCDISSPRRKVSPSCDISSPCHKDSPTPLSCCDISSPHHKGSRSCNIFSPRRKDFDTLQPSDISNPCSCQVSSPCHEDFPTPVSTSCKVSTPDGSLKDAPQSLHTHEVSSPCQKDFPESLPSCDISTTDNSQKDVQSLHTGDIFSPCHKDFPKPPPSCDIDVSSSDDSHKAVHQSLHTHDISSPCHKDFPELPPVPSCDSHHGCVPQSLSRRDAFATSSSPCEVTPSPPSRKECLPKCHESQQPTIIQLPSNPYMLEFVNDLNLTRKSPQVTRDQTVTHPMLLSNSSESTIEATARGNRAATPTSCSKSLSVPLSLSDVTIQLHSPSQCSDMGMATWKQDPHHCPSLVRSAGCCTKTFRFKLISIQRNDKPLSLTSLEQCVATRGKYKASVIVVLRNGLLKVRCKYRGKVKWCRILVSNLADVCCILQAGCEPRAIGFSVHHPNGCNNWSTYSSIVLIAKKSRGTLEGVRLYCILQAEVSIAKNAPVGEVYELLQSLDSESKVNNTLSDDNSKSYSLKDLRRPATLHFPFVACFEKPKKFQFKCISILIGNSLLSPVLLEEAIEGQGKTNFLVTITLHNGRLKIERRNHGKHYLLVTDSALTDVCNVLQTTTDPKVVGFTVFNPNSYGWNTHSSLVLVAKSSCWSWNHNDANKLYDILLDIIIQRNYTLSEVA